LPFIVISAAYSFSSYKFYRLVVVFFSPVIFAGFYAATAGILSLPHQHGITSIKLSRNLGDLRYFHRRIYGLCWTSVYYMSPIYHLFTSVHLAQTLRYRLFGYRGSSDFTTYPDTWIRDLPLLKFSDNVYLSNKATIEPNIVLHNNKILIDQITIGENSIVGHLCMLAPGVKIGQDVDIGVGCGIGIKAVIGDNASSDLRSLSNME
jgi:hypothetical protein